MREREPRNPKHNEFLSKLEDVHADLKFARAEFEFAFTTFGEPKPGKQPNIEADLQDVIETSTRQAKLEITAQVFDLLAHTSMPVEEKLNLLSKLHGTSEEEPPSIEE